MKQNEQFTDLLCKRLENEGDWNFGDKSQSSSLGHYIISTSSGICINAGHPEARYLSVFISKNDYLPLILDGSLKERIHGIAHPLQKRLDRKSDDERLSAAIEKLK